MTLIEEALTKTTDTKACVIGSVATARAAEMFVSLFPKQRAVVVADTNTWAVAGQEVDARLRSAGVPTEPAFVFSDPELFAEWSYIEQLEAALAKVDAVAVAVGSGVINDLCKLVSHRLGRRYMVVGTAASMDGYTSYGASITKDGIKQTMSCPAPLGCIVDSKVAAEAPKELVAAGYADLLAKVPAGADWILADAIGSERIHDAAWKFVQGPLRDSLSKPAACAAGDVAETEKLCEGLVMSGFAMQAMGSSRPASGTEHQFSHYWDMEGLCYGGKHVSHGFKVGIGTLASTATIEFLLERDIANLDVDACVKGWWPTFESLAATFPQVYGDRPAHIERAMSEMRGKYVAPEQLRGELESIKRMWPELSVRMRAQIMGFDEIRSALKAVGAPYEPEHIGISRQRFRDTFAGIPYMRNRYFSLDLVSRLGLVPELLNRLFGKGGVWEC
ncbi:MAG: sn-glycerol-1-phosphate dehydrogenase [Kiritimatiellae bacterium]|nr:sn-glycerol-1-phosphate dehydrogenase [Kiritimatiellia bacterium]